MAELLYRIGRASARRARTVLAVWAAALAAAALAFLVAGGTLATTFSIPGTPTAEVTDRLETELPGTGGGTGTVVFHRLDGEPIDEAQRAEVAERVAQARQVDGVADVVDPFEVEAQRAAQLQELDEARAQIEAGRAALEAGRNQLEAGRAELDAGQAQLDAAREQLDAAGIPQDAQPELAVQQEQLDAGRAELEAQEQQLVAGEQELAAGEAQVEIGTELAAMAEGVRTVSEDGSAALATVLFTDTQLEVTEEVKDQAIEALTTPGIDGVEIDLGADLTQGAPEILGVGEVVGLVVAGVVLVIMLGTFVGAGLPILTALIGVGIGTLGALSLSGVVEMAAVTPVLGLMLGLAVGIDYSLFIINRHRRQLRAGEHLHESIALANGTSGNAVVFAGSTVFIALLALNVTGIPFLGLMGTVGAMCILIAVLVATTLTPALLGLVGLRILSRRERAARDELVATHEATEAATTRPGSAEVTSPSAVPPTRPMGTPRAIAQVLVGVLGLGLIALPALDLRLNLPDGSTEAADSTQYRAFTTIAESFGEGLNGPLLVVADLPRTTTEDELLGEQFAVARLLVDQPDVTAVAPIGTSEDGRVAAFQVIPVEGPTSESTEDLVAGLREGSPLDGQYPVGVAGSASGNIDISDTLADALPLYLAVVVGLSLVILVVVFRSVFVPVIATLGFVLSYFAALGGVVAIYQWGWLGPLFGVDNPGPILNFLPTILVGILFGLAMDYMLFVGTGMREAYVHGVPARRAVTQGLRAGRSVVTAAAIIMISVFGGFVFAHSAMIRPIGFALAFGVLIDAFVVRMTIVPALMHLAGEKAWWLPRWLDRLLPSVDVEGAALERRHHRSGLPLD